MPEPTVPTRPPHLPQELWTEECRLVQWRRTGTLPSGPVDPPDRPVGLALSGGGIRSATTSLGVLQALAGLGLLPFIDYLSTVSGGGYAGAFLGGLYQRWPGPAAPQPVRQSLGAAAAQPAATITPATAPPPPPPGWERVKHALLDRRGHPVDWLRENGRYLAPNGAGDLSAAAAVVVRNLAAVQVVLASTLIALFLTANGLRRFCTWALAAVPGLSTLGDRLVGESVWWSPALYLAAVLFGLWVVPAGLAYWLVPDGPRRPGSERALLGGVWVLAAAGAAAVAAAIGWTRLAGALADRGLSGVVASGRPIWLAAVGGSTALACLVALVFTLRSGRYRNDVAGEERAPAWRGWFGARSRNVLEARNFLSLRLRTALVVTVAVALFACVDTLGQTVYAVTFSGGLGLWLAAVGGTLMAGAVVAQRLAGLLTKRTAKPISVPGSVLAAIAALALALALLVGTSAVAHSFTWTSPEGGNLVTAQTEQYVITQRGGGEWTVATTAPGDLRCGPETARRMCVPAALAPVRYTIALAVAWLLALLLGRAYAFVNNSSLSAMYGARLTRAYLGASNPERADPAAQALSIQLDKDDLKIDEYRPYTSGGPLHLINVTINETFAGRSQVEQRDRKGMGMAVGPAGISVGARHHAAFPATGEQGDRKWGPLIPTADPPAPSFRVFPSGGRCEPPVWPRLGQWIALSGAAVSTGLGSRTSLALSILVGMFNFRLGQWWRSGVEPAPPADVHRQSAPDRGSSSDAPERSGSRSPSALPRLLRWAARAFPVQAHLFDEILARFPGTSSPDWYLTDGGHFENTGAYELIRRQLPTIILCDNTADADRSFDDLANLVRKVRVDFGAQVTFLGARELDALFGCEGAEGSESGKRGVVGTLRDLGFAEVAPGADPGKAGMSVPALEPAAAVSPSVPRRYAALAHITYEGSSATSTLLLLRPAVLGTEPADVLSYHARHGKFPQQDTSDQFFDEAQWESYRCLGQHMASTVLAKFVKTGRVTWGWSLLD